jgi:hypothetical protein
MFEIIHHATSIRRRRGIALLAVLFVIMAITVLALGFVARSTTESACGQNLASRVETDQLAASGLEHARGLILNPQEAASDCWTGGVGLQLASGDRSYDVTVAPNPASPNDHCTYAVTSDAYQTRSGEKVSRSVLSAQLRLDPAVALWLGSATTLTSGWTVYGDARCGGSLAQYGTINGDVYASALTGTGVKTGQLRTAGQLGLAWPSLAASVFTSHYSTSTLASSTLAAGTYGPYDPIRVLHRQGNLIMQSNTTIRGLLLVEGNLTIQGDNNTIVAPKNVPALYVTGDLIVGNVATLNLTGLAVVGGRILLGAGATGVNVQGALFAAGTVIETAADSSGNDAYGMLYGTPQWQPSAGRINGALQFDGVDDYVRTADNSDKVQLYDDYSFAFWMNADAVQNSSAGILTKCTSDGSSTHWSVQFSSSAPRELTVKDAWGSAWSSHIYVTNVTGGWHHVCIVHNGDIIASYLDGQLKNEDDWWWGGYPSWGYGHLNIGTNRTAAANRMYKGGLDDVRIFDQALTLTEVQKLAQAQLIGVRAPIANWRLDECGAAATVAADPVKAAIVVWPGGVPTHWSPAGGAFFKQVSKVTP